MSLSRLRRPHLRLFVRAAIFAFGLAALASPFVRTSGAAAPCDFPNLTVSASLSSDRPIATITDDFNKDGKPDVAVVSSANAGSVSVWFGNGTGGFSGPRTVLGMRTPTSLASGDLNGDGNPDLVVANGANVEGELSIFLGDGTGNFGTRRQIFIIGGMANRTAGVVVADVTGDGLRDVVIISSTFGSVITLKGNGAGNVTFLTSSTTGAFFPNTLFAKDLNGDSKLDVVVSHANSNPNIAVKLGDGNGNFGAPTNFLSGVAGGAMTFADFNADGKPDLAVASISSVKILPGDGLGSFGSPTTFSLPPAAGVSALNSGDFDGDGKIDLAVLTGNDYLLICPGDGQGGFAVLANFFNGPPGLSIDAYDLVVADFNNDTQPDFAVGNQFANRLSVFLGLCGVAGVSQLQFNPPSTGATEGDSAVQASIARSGDLRGIASVQYATVDGTATSPDDYTAGFGTVSFGPGEFLKGPSIPIINDSAPENFEQFSLTLSNVTGATLLGSTLVVNVLDDDFASVTFSSATANVSETNTTLTLQVFRNGNTTAAGTVDYSTSDTSGSSNCNLVSGKASSRCDYVTTLGTISFAAGESSRIITVPIVDDAYAEGIEHFTVTLSNPTGNIILITTATVDVSIADNESTNGLNPLEGPGFFVRLHYLDFLNREPDNSGFNFWTSQITTCGNDAACLEVRRINVSASFFLSIEFQQTGYLVERFYKVAYGDVFGTSTFGSNHQLLVPVIRLNEFLRDTQRIGRGVVVLQPGWEQALENNKQAYALEFVQTSRFTGTYTTGMTPAQFVDQLNQNAGNVLSPSERATAINLFGAAGNTSSMPARAQAMRQVAEDIDLYNSESNRAFVLMQYFGYLRRNPNDPQDADYTGYDFWLTKLNQFNGNYNSAEMVKAFLSSIEYRQRFGP